VSGRFRLTNVPAEQTTIVVRRIRYLPLAQPVAAGVTDVRLLNRNKPVDAPYLVNAPVRPKGRA